MSDELKFDTAWETLQDGAEVEKAGFGLLSIRSGRICLSEGLDMFTDSNTRRDGPLVSGYHFAYWLAWNYWRLLYETKPEHIDADWSFAHDVNTIGEGYVWPQVRIWSDGLCSILSPRPSHAEEREPFRFLADTPIVLPNDRLETAIDQYVGKMLERLNEKQIHLSELAGLYAELCDERRNPALARQRRLEARLGLEPGEDHDTEVQPLIDAGKAFGESAMDEVAQGLRRRPKLQSSQGIRKQARAFGYAYRPSDQFRFSNAAFQYDPSQQPWRLANNMVAKLRDDEALPKRPVSNKRLAELFGTRPTVLDGKAKGGEFGFSLAADTDQNGQVVLKSSQWESTRRFALARLLCDSLLHEQEPLHPSFSISTYRQKTQKAFAAELLCPYDALKDFLGDDFSNEKQQTASKHFNVSERTVESILKNHGDIERSDADEDLFHQAA